MAAMSGRPTLACILSGSRATTASEVSCVAVRHSIDARTQFASSRQRQHAGSRQC